MVGALGAVSGGAALVSGAAEQREVRHGPRGVSAVLAVAVMGLLGFAWVCLVLRLLYFQHIQAAGGSEGLAERWVALCGSDGDLGCTGTEPPHAEGQPVAAVVNRFGGVRLFDCFTPS